MILHGDSLEVLKTLDANSVDSVCTDPPYGLSFMGKRWDYDVPSVELWREVLRVLKPGGHLLSFGGTRTYHRMVVNIEDAGFEIRDQIQWLYASGFPKSLDVSKAIDKSAGAEREVIGKADRKNGATGFASGDCVPNITAPATPEAQRWQGWGTALKPANEPIVLARKPLEKGLAIAENVLKYSTGALNVDASRIATDESTGREGRVNKRFEFSGDGKHQPEQMKAGDARPNTGRWPANVLFDEDAAAGLDAVNAKELPARYFYCAKASKRERNAGLDKTELVWEKDAWESADLKSALADILRLAKDTSDAILADDKSWNIEQFGLSISEQSQVATTFTIKTALKLTIELKTSNAFQSSTTRESIQDAIKTIEANGSSLAECAATISRLRQSFTSVPTASTLDVARAACEYLSAIRSAAKSGNFHSTVKPVKLMEYLCRMITPPAGRILDPFAGSGSTGVAAKRLGFGFVGIEREAEYVAIATKRVESA